ncbi:MAG: tetratricopeptide repeat protein, partial [Actinophytocola sp.]|uniref:ATP-binding protein n=1 Tax=Actinophytocola sp. TaxID=1872138 RepID=UPI003C739B23
MVRSRDDAGDPTGNLLDRAATITAVGELSVLLRELRRRHARTSGNTPLTYRELAGSTGWAHGIIGNYFAGKTLPPTDRFDVLIRLLGASGAEQRALATARDRVEEHRRNTPQHGLPLPRELPRDTTMFVGRKANLAALDTVAPASPGQDTSAVVVVSGTAGVGKTALAVHWAHRVADRFPDGSLYVDLRGYSYDAPMRPEQALSGFLRGLGCRAADLPTGLPELAARYRSLLAGRRLLVLLDNAHDAEQVRPLLPGAAHCLVVVTSRDTLAGLVARDGATRVVLGRLTDHEAELLLRRLIGERAAAEPSALAALAKRCARLPLALRVAAELAANRHGAPVSELVDELAHAQPLEVLTAGGDAASAVRGVFSWSYQHLSAPAARTFRLLGLHPGGDFDVAAVGALTGDGRVEAACLLRDLDRAHLIEPRRRGRYGLHDLLRDYAAERVAGEPADDRDAAMSRLLTYYENTAAAATRTLYQNDGERAAADTAAALDWLDTERANLVAASGTGVPGFASTMSATLWRYLDTGGGHADEVLAIHGHALSDALRRGDLADQGAALGRLGQAHGRLAGYPTAIDHMRQSLAISREIGDPAGENAMLNSLAQVCGRLGRHAEAIEHLDRALAIDRRLGDRAGEAKALGNLGIVHAQLGHYREARQRFADALRLARLVGDVNRESEALNNLGLVHCWLGEYDEAVSLLWRGLRIARDVGARSGEGRLLANLGVAHTGLAEF